MVPNLFYEMPGYSAMGGMPGASAGAVSGRTADSHGNHQFKGQNSIL